MATTLPRITARVDADTQELLTKAAAIAGMTSISGDEKCKKPFSVK